MTSNSTLMSAALYANSHLGEDLSLARMADLFGLSPSHFQKSFLAEFGESPKRFVERLRLERAACHMLLHQRSILEIALDLGFSNPETFNRAFQRHFKMPPSQFRKAGRIGRSTRQHQQSSTELATTLFELSKTSCMRLSPSPIAFVRHLGPYDQVQPELWSSLIDWFDQAFPEEFPLKVGIGWDVPGLTQDAKLRFDAALVLPRGMEPNIPWPGPLASLPKGRYAMTTHYGAYHSLPDAYPAIFSQIQNLQRITVSPSPVIEIYRDQTIDAERTISTTEVYVALEEEHQLV